MHQHRRPAHPLSGLFSNPILAIFAPESEVSRSSRSGLDRLEGSIIHQVPETSVVAAEQELQVNIRYWISVGVQLQPTSWVVFTQLAECRTGFYGVSP